MIIPKSWGLLMKKDRNYVFTEDQMRFLGGLVILPHNDRVEILHRIYQDLNYKPEDMIEMFSNFIDLANTVVENCDEHIRLYAITEMGMHPNDADRINMPSILGAVKGVEITQGLDQAKMCHGCAFRRGSVANTCLVTTMDTEYCEENLDVFMCHENLTDNGNPTKKCRGFLKKIKTKIPIDE